jgi:hypothetical protein
MSRIVSSLRVLPLRMTKEGNSSKQSLSNHGACCADQTVNDISSLGAVPAFVDAVGYLQGVAYV